MGDVFLHVAFARRIRQATELHPLAVQASLRHAPAVTIGSALAFLPQLDTKKIGFFRRLFGGGATEDKWSTHFTGAEPKVDLALALLDPSREDSPGSMLRLALAMGVLTGEILRAKTHPLLGAMEPNERAATSRALTRLWLQQSVPRLASLEREWAPGIGLHEKQHNKRIIAAIRSSAFVAYGSAPQTDQWQRWLKGLSTALAGANGGLPSETTVTTASVEQSIFREQNFVGILDEAQTWSVYLFNRLAESFMNGEPEREQLQSLLCDASGSLRELPSDDVLAGAEERHISAMADLREEHQGRGRNAEAAFAGSSLLDELPALPPLPPEDGPPPLQPEPETTPKDGSPALVADESAAVVPPSATADSSEANAAEQPAPTKEAFETPANTQLVDETAIEEIAAGALPSPSADAAAEAVENAVASQAAADAPHAPPPPPAPAAPTSTQQISAADIEAELVSSEDANEDAKAPPPAPTPAPPSATQQISAADIEAELVSSEAAPESALDDAASEASASPATPPPAPAPAAPTATQQISAADIEAELVSTEAANDTGASLTAPVTPPPAPAPAAPTATQQISAADIEAELVSSEDANEAGATPPPAPAPAAPAATQQISAADIEAEIVEQSANKES